MGAQKTNQLFAICLPLNVSIKAVSLWNSPPTHNSYALERSLRGFRRQQ